VEAANPATTMLMSSLHSNCKATILEFPSSLHRGLDTSSSHGRWVRLHEQFHRIITHKGMIHDGRTSEARATPLVSQQFYPTT
jgi:hypothetical protein